ncbi:MAG TPA: ankyrin repeat domain-containing protein [Rickettsia endosymbiont of Degeeriella rufa]|nr:ankyrin repeat domain-containing protein [Rickettsia endosymbiont of Degeeriella rufa]
MLTAAAGGGVTVLHYAAKSELNEVCKIVVPMLTQHELEYKDLYGNTALHLLIQSELSDTAILVISRISREAIEYSNDHNYTPLQYARQNLDY